MLLPRIHLIRFLAAGTIAVAGLSHGVAQETVDFEDLDRSPIVETWFPADLPAGLPKSAADGEVTVVFTVEADGTVSDTRVEETTDERLNEAAVASLRLWTFEPGTRDKEPTPYSMRVHISFETNAQARARRFPPHSPETLPLRSARVKKYGKTEDPPILLRRGLTGNVTLEFIVDPEGRPLNPKVISTNCPDYVAPSINSLMLTEFHPAQQGDLKIAAPMQAPFEFVLFDETRLMKLIRNQILPLGADDWEGYDELPEPIAFAEPTYPRELLLAGEGGEARVSFTVSRSGIVSDISVESATAPEFGEALAAAMAYWAFVPPKDDVDGWIETRMIIRQVFTPPTSPDESPEARLAALLQPDGPGVSSARGLDGRLSLLYRAPVIPPELEDNQPGSAQVEFIVDRDGRARLPRVREASSKKFGWAAATAIGQCLFKAPTKDGEPVDVRVVIPISYTP